MRHAQFRFFGVVFSLLFISLGCSSKVPSSPETGGQAQGGASSSRVVNIATWSNYLAPAVIEEFQKTTGIKVQMANYSSNEELLAKLQAGASGYDVAVPSDYMVSVMGKLALLQPLDHAKLSEMKNLDPKLLKKGFDPQNQFSVPYDWGTTGIAVHRDLYQGKIESWKDLFETPALKGKFTLLDDVRETVGAALKSQGLSLNSRKGEDLAKAKEVLLKAKKSVKAFSSEPLMLLLNKETAVAHAYSSDALQARVKTNGKVDFIIPKEGATFWIDNLVIPKGAAHLEEAHAFINFLLSVKANTAGTNTLFFAPSNREAFKLLSKELQANTMLFPPESVLQKTEMVEDLGDAMAAWDRIWTEVKVQ